MDKPEWGGLSKEDASQCAYALRLTARRANDMYDIGYQDAYHEASIALATNDNLRSKVIGHNGRRAGRAMFKLVFEDPMRQSAKGREGDTNPPLIIEEPPAYHPTDYDADEIVELLVLRYAPSLVDCFRERTVESGLPVFAPDPSKKHTDWAKLADIDTAFEKAKITLDEERSAFMYYVLGYNSIESGKILGCKEETVLRRARKTVAKLMTALNGKESS